ncbi:MAG: adenylosuccinate synthase [Elusimicrobiota bacterium]|jgi:adenylosuccinate synthase|nr:adenylosuccinate synthase [Elusimicrobiota bacterium]
MPATIVLGAQWGDEGKGKVVHFLAEDADFIVRYQGGNNAGHTLIVNNKPFALHLIPSGILYPKKICLIANGAVVDLQSLKDEIAALKKIKVSVSGRLFISAGAHIVLPYHLILDSISESGAVKIGTTKRGIGPAYTDKIKRIGIRAADYLEKDLFLDLLEANLADKAAVLEKAGVKISELKERILKEHKTLSAFFKPFIADTSLILDEALRKNKKILFESSQGTLLDVDFGTYPFVTSSNPIAGGVCAGAGIVPNAVKNTVGVLKAYSTRVGEGPFPTELFDASGDFLRERGAEYGATTGRPRRCGWFDAVIAKYSVRINGINNIVLTKLDCMRGIEKIKICSAYKYKGKIYKDFPLSRTIQKECKPVYEEIPGFTEDISGINDFNKLPKNVKNYIKRLESLAGAPISYISLGPKKEEMLSVGKSIKLL